MTCTIAVTVACYRSFFSSLVFCSFFVSFFLSVARFRFVSLSFASFTDRSFSSLVSLLAFAESHSFNRSCALSSKHTTHARFRFRFVQRIALSLTIANSGGARLDLYACQYRISGKYTFRVASCFLRCFSFLSGSIVSGFVFKWNVDIQINVFNLVVIMYSNVLQCMRGVEQDKQKRAQTGTGREHALGSPFQYYTRRRATLAGISMWVRRKGMSGERDIGLCEWNSSERTCAAHPHASSCSCD